MSCLTFSTRMINIKEKNNSSLRYFTSQMLIIHIYNQEFGFSISVSAEVRTLLGT